MLTEGFMDSCFKLLLSKKLPFKGEKAIFRDIQTILLSVGKKKNFEVPIQLKNKFDILRTVVALRLEDKEPDLVFDSISVNKNASSYLDFLHYILKQEYSKRELDSYAAQVILRKKFTSLMSSYDEIATFLDRVNSGTYSNMETAINEYEDLVRSMYIDISEMNKHKAVECGASLDFDKDDYSSLVERVIKFSSHENAIPTGFSVLDNQIMSGGFEPLRLYVIAGGSGSGKSTLLLNFIKNAAILNKSNEDGKKSVFLYITLENSLEESFLRLYQSIGGFDKQQALSNLKNGLDVKSYIKDQIGENNNIVMNYFPAGTTSVVDISSKIDDIQSDGKSKVRAVFVDYLDFLKSDRLYEQKRHELGFITLCLKTLAVDYQIPVITPTQLNRAVYSVKSALEFNASMIGESIQKVENSDFVLMTARSQTDENAVLTRVVKFRNGPSGACLQFNVDFEKFLFKTCIRENTNAGSVDSSLFANDVLKFSF